MNRPILIVRTVSVERLSTVLNCSLDRWPGHPIWVVTSQNRVGELVTDGRIDRVEGREGGYLNFGCRYESDTFYEAVVLPLANRKGSGYSNVLRSFSRVRCHGFFLSPFCRYLRPVSRTSLVLKAGIEEIIAASLRPVGALLARLVLRVARIPHPAGSQAANLTNYNS